MYIVSQIKGRDKFCKPKSFILHLVNMKIKFFSHFIITFKIKLDLFLTPCIVYIFLFTHIPRVWTFFIHIFYLSTQFLDKLYIYIFLPIYPVFGHPLYIYFTFLPCVCTPIYLNPCVWKSH